ncbi:MAG: ribosomal protein S18-alanine N-acetyltransferase [Desulfuromusa sp.]|nr:ribosomal protein S18-alanine N-acetyltransferase [Desulfuromusa sp.]
MGQTDEFAASSLIVRQAAREKCAFRLISVTDLDAVLAIERQCYPHPWSSQQFLQELANPVASILVCEIEDKIGGYICYWLIAGEMQILNLATSLQVRRKGIAAQLLEQAFERCSLSELSSVWLEVRSGNQAAIALYQRYGFKLSGTRRAYYRDGEDAFVMVKNFTDQKFQEKIQ